MPARTCFAVVLLLLSARAATPSIAELEAAVKRSPTSAAAYDALAQAQLNAAGNLLGQKFAAACRIIMFNAARAVALDRQNQAYSGDLQVAASECLHSAANVGLRYMISAAGRAASVPPTFNLAEFRRRAERREFGHVPATPLSSVIGVVSGCPSIQADVTYGSGGDSSQTTTTTPWWFSQDAAAGFAYLSAQKHPRVDDDPNSPTFGQVQGADCTLTVSLYLVRWTLRRFKIWSFRNEGASFSLPKGAMLMKQADTDSKFGIATVSGGS